jgi:general secretion pathway protein C
MKWSTSGKRIVLAGYLSLIALTIAHTTNALVADALYAPLYTPDSASSGDEVATPVDPSPEMAQAILHSGLFLLPPTLDDPLASGQSAGPPQPPMETAKKVALVGTVLGQGGGVMAVLEDSATKKQSLYRIGSDVPNVGTLAEIEKNRVLFREGAQEEWLSLALTQQGGAGASSAMPQAPTPVQTPPGPQRRVLDRREVTAALDDTTRLLTQAQAVPYLTDGKLDGFRLYNVAPRGFVDKIGLQNNDLVQRINGVELRDPSMVLTLFQQLRQERSVRVDLVRNSQRQTITYEIR